MTPPTRSLPRRLLRWFGMLLGAFVLLIVACNAYVILSTSGRVFDRVEDVPSGGVGLVLGTLPSADFFDHRLDAGGALWKAGKVKYLIASGNRADDYDEPTYMRGQLIERGVPAQAIYRDFAGVRTRDSILGAREVYGQQRFIVVSQRFHVARALFLARREGMEAWGFEARDVEKPYSVFTELRRYPSALRAYYDVWAGTPPRHAGKPVAIGVDPPN